MISFCKLKIAALQRMQTNGPVIADTSWHLVDFGYMGVPAPHRPRKKWTTNSCCTFSRPRIY